MFDLLICGAVVMDGTGGAPYAADIGVRDGIIAELGSLSGREASRVIDASGKLVTPGFIDAHSHADCSAPMWPDMESSLGQGITTCVAGHCGMGVAPVQNYWLEMCFEEAAFNRLLPWPTGGPVPGHGRVAETKRLRPCYEAAFGQPLDWGSFEEYLGHLDRGIGANLVCFVGHSQLRQQILGINAKRPATQEELLAIGELLQACYAAGAWGLSLGLDYDSSMDADREELLYLMELTRKNNRIVTCHAQSRPMRRGMAMPGFAYGEGLREVLELARESGARLHISHLRGTADTPADLPGAEEKNTAAAQETLQLIHNYRDMGVKVTWDLLCGPAVPVFHYPQLCCKFRPYVDECGGPEGFAGRLENDWYRNAVLTELRSGNHRGKQSFLAFRPESAGGLRIIRAKDKSLEGKTLAELAALCGTDLTETALDLLREDPFIMCGQKQQLMEAQARVFVREQDTAFGTDNGTYNYDYEQQDGPGLTSHGSPSAFCQMIEYLLADFGLPFEQIIARMTGNAATAYGITDRGFLRVGQAADLLVLDRNKLASNYRLTEPRTLPDGLDYVIVNGRLAKEGKTFTHTNEGRALRWQEPKKEGERKHAD